MNNPERILNVLDSSLAASVELTIYGRAALALGFPNSPKEYALSKDIDVVLWLGQEKVLNRHPNFWDAIETTNRHLASDGLYITHLFDEDQVILRPNWQNDRVRFTGAWKQLNLWRLGDVDLFLSKLMRYDAIDLADAHFIMANSELPQSAFLRAIENARVPDIPEIQEEFTSCVKQFLES